MKIVFLLIIPNVLFAQENQGAGTFDNFLEDYDEVTQPPLKSIGALPKCGEEVDQKERSVCVPYYNCNPDTHTVEASPDNDGSSRIHVRLGEDQPVCKHYMEVCCKISNSGDDNGNGPTQPTQPPTGPNFAFNNDSNTGGGTEPTQPIRPPIISNSTSNNNSNTGNGNGNQPRTPGRAFCGIRNSQGLDFNLVGGTNEANFGESPWMVAILRKNPVGNDTLAVCGGSLISPGVVLTGAHCVAKIDVNAIKIRAGEWDTQTKNERIPYQERNVVRKIIHEGFMRANLYNNVALLILDRQFTKVDSVGTICLPNENQKINSRACLASGWGRNLFGQEGRYATILKKIQLPLVPNDECQKALRTTVLGKVFILHRSFICAGGEANIDTCTGDGGSPLVCPDPSNPNRYVQVGIVSWGIECGQNDIPGVYTDMTQFRNWVDLRLQELGISSASYIN